jgi:hypothetical protein
MAYDSAFTFRGFARDGMLGGSSDADRIAGMVGRPLRT